MDSDLARLCALPGTHDLSLNETAEVLQVSTSYIQRVQRRGLLEAKRYQGRGDTAHRVRIPRAAVVRYLVNISSGDKSVILSAIAAQCPQYLHAAQGTEPTPSNVIPMHGARKQRLIKDPYAGHPQLFSA